MQTTTKLAREVESGDVIVSQNNADTAEVVWTEVAQGGIRMLLGTDTGEYLREFYPDQTVTVAKNLYTTGEVIDLLEDLGHARDDIEAAMTSLLTNSSPEAGYTDEGEPVWNQGDVEVLTSQLAGDTGV